VQPRPTCVLVLPKLGYRNDDLLEAAALVGLDVFEASDRCHVLAEDWREGSLPLDFTLPQDAAAELAAAVGKTGRRPVAVLGVDEQTALIAAGASALLGLPHSPPDAVAAAKDKWEMRARLRAARVPSPWCELVPRDLEGPALEALCLRAVYPCVVKPRALSASRGVIRADDAQGLREALARLAKLLASAPVASKREPLLDTVIVEEFLPGPEIAVEGLLEHGELKLLAVFDKPDPLDGPFFEETLYITPSRHPAALQAAAVEMTARSARAMGLTDGPLHAELRLTPHGPRTIEVAARSIGGLCGRTLRFGLGLSLEELVLRHAVSRAGGTPFALPAREERAAGVLMLPIRKRGQLREVRGVEAARAVPGIADVVISVRPKEELVPLPEGASYLGFVFARAGDADAVEAALRAAGELLEAVVAPWLEIAPRQE
jgi:biotin carboxylase